MSRRREAREQQQTEFLQQNPTLIEYNTRIEPAKNDSNQYVLQVTQDDNDPVQTDVPEFDFQLFPPKIEGALPYLITVEDEIEAPGAELDASYTYVNWRGQTREADGLVAISGLGIGVNSASDIGGIVGEIFKGDLGLEDLTLFASISDNEKLGVEVSDEAPEGAVEPTAEDAPFLDLNGREVGIGFDVISGEGQIMITLINSDTGEISEQLFDTFIAGQSRRPSVEDIDHILAEMPEGGNFDQFKIGTTGDLEITVTGIDLVSGYNYGEVVPS